MIQQTDDQRDDVELTGTLTRGMMVRDRSYGSKKPINAKVILSFDLQAYQNMLIWTAARPSASTDMSSSSYYEDDHLDVEYS